MQPHHEPMKIDEHLTDAEIRRAIHHLDPEVCTERTEEDSGTLVGICIALLTGLTGAIAYICLYMRIV